MEYKVVHFSDPGHGWGRVPRSIINELGIADTISEYSYEEKEFVYLEEDCDLYRFVKAMEARGDTVKFESVYHERSRIRTLRRYNKGN